MQMRFLKETICSYMCFSWLRAEIKLIKPQIRKHPLGVQITERVMTDGPVAKTGKVVTIKYECKLPTGEQIDAGERTFRLGS